MGVGMLWGRRPMRARLLPPRLKNGLLRVVKIGFDLPRTARNGVAQTARKPTEGADHERAWRVEQIA
jgi:hypothetical protein